MFIRASNSFLAQFKCDVSLSGQQVPQPLTFEGWSCHFIRVGSKPLVVVMNDATLYSFLIPTKGMKSFEDFLRILLFRIEETWAAHGAEFDSDNLSVLVFKRTNRSLIGSMNDAIQNIRFVASCCREEGTPVDWIEMEDKLNHTPMGALEFAYPVERLAEKLSPPAPDGQADS